MMPMTVTEKFSTETLLNAELRDGKICKYNLQNAFHRAEVFLLHSE